ncbi:hypothetical protein B0H14DRAFT_3470599 [Mycena olivaceomarginata]|nr:hypothetical protein B0H14DRAFT_3470599 [Mycena olivaceomarginata]
MCLPALQLLRLELEMLRWGAVHEELDVFDGGGRAGAGVQLQLQSCVGMRQVDQWRLRGAGAAGQGPVADARRSEWVTAVRVRVRVRVRGGSGSGLAGALSSTVVDLPPLARQANRASPTLARTPAPAPEHALSGSLQARHLLFCTVSALPLSHRYSQWCSSGIQMGLEAMRDAAPTRAVGCLEANYPTPIRKLTRARSLWGVHGV